MLIGVSTAIVRPPSACFLPRLSRISAINEFCISLIHAALDLHPLGSSPVIRPPSLPSRFAFSDHADVCASCKTPSENPRDSMRLQLEPVPTGPRDPPTGDSHTPFWCPKAQITNRPISSAPLRTIPPVASPWLCSLLLPTSPIPLPQFDASAGARELSRPS
jgi:hypothetical protein